MVVGGILFSEKPALEPFWGKPNGRFYKRMAESLDVENNFFTSSASLSLVYYGSFMRSFSLPSPVNEDKVNGCYENGVLPITVLDLETSKANEVKIE